MHEETGELSRTLEKRRAMSIIKDTANIAISSYLDMTNFKSAEHVLAGAFQDIDVQLDQYGDYRGVLLRTPDGYVLDTCHKELRRADGLDGLTYHYQSDDIGIHTFCKERYYLKGYIDLDELEPHDCEML